jgi:TRAP-type C4-dicarboxylate transport system permease small subunit
MSAEQSHLDEDAGDRADRAVRQQQAVLSRAWRAFDRILIRATCGALFIIGALFTVMVTAEVFSRYVLSFSIFFVNAGARLLLVWFFLIGAGIALRHNAHVGFELLVSRLHGARRRNVLTLAYACCLAFFLEMIWGGLYSIGPALPQNEAGLGISVMWFVLAVPVGFALLAYHTVVLLRVLWSAPAGGAPVTTTPVTRTAPPPGERP